MENGMPFLLPEEERNLAKEKLEKLVGKSAGYGEVSTPEKNGRTFLCNLRNLYTKKVKVRGRRKQHKF